MDTTDSPLEIGRRAWSPRFVALIHRSRKWLLILMLASLSGALLPDFQTPVARALLAAHFGLFLLWQPLLSTERKLNWRTLTGLAAVGAALIIPVFGWIIVVWTALLIALMGGRVFVARMPKSRLFYLVGLAYLLLLLLTWMVPRLILGQRPASELDQFTALGLPALLAVMAAIQVEPDVEQVHIIDFFYSLMLFQLVLLLVLGSIAMMRYTGDRYLLALASWVLVAACTLLALAVLWSPPAGLGGLRAYLSRYLMSVGVPSEQWLRRLAEIAEQEPSPARFLERTIDEVATLPWAVGGEWTAADSSGAFGAVTEHTAEFSAHTLRFKLYASHPLGPALMLHMRLLVQLWGEFYEGKRREQALKKNAYMQAVHETGARLTHDVKNLLQSLYALTSAGQKGGESDPAFARLLQRQLPELTKRLRMTLDKLRSPTLPESALWMPAGVWWQQVRERYEGRDIEFLGEFDAGERIPAALFDSVVDNCIDNARRKRAAEPGIAIAVALESKPDLRLSVTDSGSPIPAQRIAELFVVPMDAADGMGIGLYQAARQAEQAGFALRLTANAPGCVVIELAPRPAS